MKQRISLEQLNQLNKQQQEKLRAWWQPQRGDWVAEAIYLKNSTLITTDVKAEELILCDRLKSNLLPLLSIGRCIELLYQTPEGRYSVAQIFNSLAGEPIDRLWEATKSIL